MIKFGLRAQWWIVIILQAHGYCVRSERVNGIGDRIFKLDFWIAREEYWVPVQFSINRREMLGEKGIDALRRRICPCYLNGEKLEEAVFFGNQALQKILVAELLKQIESFIAVYPEIVCRRPAVEALAVHR